MKALWTLLKVILVLVLVLPVAVIALSTVLGIFGALLGLAILALKVAVVGFVAWGALKLIGRVLRGPAPQPQRHEIRALAPRDRYYEAALRELDQEVGSHSR
jgi:hypothetical protein